MKIGQVIRRHRRALGMTLETLAAQSGTDAANLSRIERGLQNYTPEGILALAAGLGTTVSALMSEAEIAEKRECASSSGVSPRDEAEQDLIRSFRVMGGASRIALRQVAADMAKAYVSPSM